MLIEGDYGRRGIYTIVMTVSIRSIAHTHTLTLVPANPSTCTQPGNTAYYVCDDCGKWFEDEAGTVEITDHSSVVVPAGHTPSDWQYDTDQHWKVCTVADCGVVIAESVAAHSYGDDDVCDICGYIDPTPTYQFLEGANGQWTQSSGGPLTFRASGNFARFTGVKIDGVLIDASNYTARAGSTIVSLGAGYLQTLAVGSHTLTVVYTNGECSTRFVVSPVSVAPVQSPQTGENAAVPVFWIALFLVSMAGFAGTLVYSQKKKDSAK